MSYVLPIASWLLRVFKCCCQVTQSCPTLCDPMDCSMPGCLVLHHLPELAQTHVRWVGDAIQPSHPLSSPSPPARNLLWHQGLFKESILHIRWPNYWNFNFNISPSNDYSGLISIRIEWFDLLMSKGTLHECLQHLSLRASILQALSLLYSPTVTSVQTTGTIIALTLRTSVSKLMSLLLHSPGFR